MAVLNTCELILPALSKAALNRHGDRVRFDYIRKGAADRRFAEAAVVSEIDIALRDDRWAGV